MLGIIEGDDLVLDCFNGFGVCGSDDEFPFDKVFAFQAEIDASRLRINIIIVVNHRQKIQNPSRISCTVNKDPHPVKVIKCRIVTLPIDS